MIGHKKDNKRRGKRGGDERGGEGRVDYTQD